MDLRGSQCFPVDLSNYAVGLQGSPWRYSTCSGMELFLYASRHEKKAAGPFFPFATTDRDICFRAIYLLRARSMRERFAIISAISRPNLMPFFSCCNTIDRVYYGTRLRSFDTAMRQRRAHHLVISVYNIRKLHSNDFPLILRSRTRTQ